MTSATLAPAPVRWQPLLLGALGTCAVSVVLSMFVGGLALDPATVWQALQGSAAAEAEAVVVGQRIPRTILGILGGAALATAGAVIQGHTRNPLADPGLLGVTAGASLAVVLAVSLLGLTSPAGYLWFAFGGAALGSALVTALGLATGRRRDGSPAALVLAGAGVSAFLSAVTGVVLLLDVTTLDLFRFWTVGSLTGGRGPEVIAPVAPLLAAGLLLAVAHAPTLNTLSLGDDVARSLGSGLVSARLVGLTAVTLLVGSATALVGSLGFIGLIAPHVVRRFSGPDHRVLVPVCALAGASLVVLADVVGRVIISPAELPVGIVLAVVGGPIFLLIVVQLLRGRR
ncbi:FecCD family ABC transporter permease [Nocardioides rotundus]|uniref:FecCD family ABC transporter permease n=1 Tax=Nocardioides rotundus TaxID=1774216 RepID=UPI001CBACAAE|nr:iron ABC transporter permease [Nocardioides rotundus]